MTNRRRYDNGQRLAIEKSTISELQQSLIFHSPAQVVLTRKFSVSKYFNSLRK